MRTTNENRNIIIFIIIIMWLGVGMMLLALDPFVVHVEGIFFFCFSFIGRRTMFLLNKIAQSQAMDDDDEEEADEKQNRSIFGVIPNTQFTQFSSWILHGTGGLFLNSRNWRTKKYHQKLTETYLVYFTIADRIDSKKEEPSAKKTRKHCKD